MEGNVGGDRILLIAEEAFSHPAGPSRGRLPQYCFLSPVAMMVTILWTIFNRCCCRHFQLPWPKDSRPIPLLPPSCTNDTILKGGFLFVQSNKEMVFGTSMLVNVNNMVVVVARDIRVDRRTKEGQRKRQWNGRHC